MNEYSDEYLARSEREWQAMVDWQNANEQAIVDDLTPVRL